jgi:3-dehydro-L-gulonate 2-dehydrogenase
MSGSDIILISLEKMQQTFREILLQHDFTEEKATLCANIFAENSLDGVYTHGVNRFPRFVEYVRKGFILPDKEAVFTNGFKGMEQWDGQTGPGPVNALIATDRAMELASQNGIGCVALANTNHWMRGGTYGWKAAKAGYVFLGWTNTLANMPAWGAMNAKLGNNPLVMAVPYQKEAIVLDMAMSQYSYGAMEQAALQASLLPTAGGFDINGKLTDDPAAILTTGRVLPAGYWKGAGLALLLDILATILSGGISTLTISQQESEYNLSQVFVAIDLSKLSNHATINSAIQQIIEDYHQSVPEKENGKILYPGERVLQTRKTNLEKGIPVLKTVWEMVMGL